MLNEQNTSFASKFMELLSGGKYDYTMPRPSTICEALILQRGAGDLVVDIGAKRDAVVPAHDLQHVPRERVDALRVGDTIHVMVMRMGPGTNDLIPVSFSQGLQQEDWLRAQEMVETGETVECEVVETNRGGVVVRFGRLRGFVPNSHLGSLPSGGRPGQSDEAKEALVGTTMRLAMIDVNAQRRRLVLSRRAVERKRRSEIITELETGQVRKGYVQNLVDFGAFIDLGGIDGLVHISELAWEHVTHPSEVLSLGEEIEVYVLQVDLERQRIGLSRKRLLPDPWDEVTADLAIGDTVVGRVTNVVDFGLFVEIGKGVEGLVHETKLQSLYGETRDDIATGANVLVQILAVDHDKHQLSLGLLEVLREKDVPVAVDPDVAVVAADDDDDDPTAPLDDEAEPVVEGDVLLY
jgi:small subunit ribosomal protein S1